MRKLTAPLVNIVNTPPNTSYRTHLKKTKQKKRVRVRRAAVPGQVVSPQLITVTSWCNALNTVDAFTWIFFFFSIRFLRLCIKKSTLNLETRITLYSLKGYIYFIYSHIHLGQRQ